MPTDSYLHLVSALQQSGNTGCTVAFATSSKRLCFESAKISGALRMAGCESSMSLPSKSLGKQPEL